MELAGCHPYTVHCTLYTVHCRRRRPGFAGIAGLRGHTIWSDWSRPATNGNSQNRCLENDQRPHFRVDSDGLRSILPVTHDERRPYSVHSTLYGESRRVLPSNRSMWVPDDQSLASDVNTCCVGWQGCQCRESRGDGYRKIHAHESRAWGFAPTRYSHGSAISI